MMADLPDTPPWSRRRIAFAWSLFAAGCAMVLLGVCPAISDARAALLIDQGAGMILAGPMLVIGGASGERVAAWWGGRRGAAPSRGDDTMGAR